MRRAGRVGRWKFVCTRLDRSFDHNGGRGAAGGLDADSAILSYYQTPQVQHNNALKLQSVLVHAERKYYTEIQNTVNDPHCDDPVLPHSLALRPFC